MGACCSGIGTSPSPEETAVKIRARNNFRDKYTRENEEHQKQKRIDEQGEVWQQQREEAARVRRLREAGQQNRNKQRQERDRKLQEEQKKEEDRRNRKDVKRYDKAQQMPDDSYGGSQAPYKYQAKQHNVQNTGRPVRIDGRMEGKAQKDAKNRGKLIDKSPDETNNTFYEISLKEDDQTAVLTEQRQNVKGKQSGGGIHVIPPDVGKEELKDDRPHRSKVRQRAATAPDVKGVDRNRKQDDMLLPMGPRKPIKGIGQPDKNHEKLELENDGDEQRPGVPKTQLKDDRPQHSKVRQRAATAPDVKGVDRNRKQDDMLLLMGPRKPIKGIGQPDKNHEKLELENVRDKQRPGVPKKRPRKPEVVEVSGVQRVQEIEKAKMKKDEKTIHSEAQRQQQESDQEISESGHEVAKVKIHPSDVDPIIRERALTSQY
ncbi:intersectin-1 [Magallana gigas]|uniref:intersectin-1 n=1 Tax=Magallana gigas TaxID=29159 RepID=UPI003341D6A9